MQSYLTRRLTLLVLVSVGVGLFVFDQSTSWLDPGRYWLNNALSPLFEIARVPRLGQSQSSRILQSKQQLIQDIAHLETQALARSFEVKKLSRLAAENQSLRTLLDLKTLTPDVLLAAEVLMVRITPLHHKLVLNKGRVDGVVLNSIVFDELGMVGQVHFVTRHQSWVTLISDPDHGVPALVSRSGASGFIQGTGELDRIVLQFVPETSDVQVGDKVKTSGLGGRFSAGYTLGKVTAVAREEQQPFLAISLRPASHLTQLQFVLIKPPLLSEALILDNSLADQ